MGYVGELSDHLHGIRELLGAALARIEDARVDSATRRRLGRRVRSRRRQLELLGELAADDLLRVDVLPAGRRVKVRQILHRPLADIEIDAGG